MPALFIMVFLMKMLLLLVLAFALLAAGCAQTQQTAHSPPITAGGEQPNSSIGSGKPAEASTNQSPQAPATSPSTATVPPAAPIQGPAIPSPEQPYAPEPQTAANGTPAAPEPEMERGTIDPDFEVTVYNKSAALFGTTIFPDNHISGKPRIVEVNMLGEVLWVYELPTEWKDYTNPGFDVEPLANGNVLFVLPRKGVFEVSRDKKIVWSYYDSKVSHDADRLSNGNTLIAFGAYDTQNDAQAKEVSPSGKVVWSYYAKKDFFKPPYDTISDEGWTHTNAVSRLENGNTWVNFRNFNILVEISPEGKLVKTINNGEFYYQHDPVLLSDGNILLANHATPNEILETDGNGTILWRFVMKDRNAWPVRDANRLSNGNTLITGTDRILEITQGGEIVWALKIKNAQFTQQTAPALGFYKAERIAP